MGRRLFVREGGDSFVRAFTDVVVVAQRPLAEEHGGEVIHLGPTILSHGDP